MRRIYMDYNATCPVRPEVIERVSEAMAIVGNASSIHGDGRSARKIVEDSRDQIASFVNVTPAQVIFNSGATEGNNTILSGFRDKTVLISAIEHPSIIEAASKADQIPVTKSGIVDLAKLEKMLSSAKVDLICVQLVNSETGAIQPVAEIAALAKKHNAKLHCDAVQAAGRIAIDFKTLGCDYMTLSAHKFGGPQGVGALIFRQGLLLPKLLLGGGQEKRQRAGTENVAGIAGFRVAASLAAKNIADYQAKTKAFQDKLEAGLRSAANGLIIVSDSTPRVTNTTNVILPGVTAETQLMAMDLEGVSLSSGSACSSGSFKPSHVLAAMGYKDESKSALRFSTGWNTTSANIENAVAAYGRMVKRVRK